MKQIMKLQLLTSALFLSACGGAGTSSTEEPATTNNDNSPKEQALLAPNLSVAEAFSSTIIGNTLLININNSAGAAIECSSQPTLPAGLKIDTVAGDCIIYGAAVNASAETEYVVTASNSIGSAELNLTLEVQPVPAQAPSFSTLGSNYFSWKQNSSVALVLENTGGHIANCAITPSLPAGLTLLSQEGSCSLLGIAGQAQSSSRYTLKGSNESGITELDIIIEIAESTDYSGDGPDPKEYDYVTTLSENRTVNDSSIVALHGDINHPENILQLASSGFPNNILQVQSSDNSLLTNASDIDNLFRLYIEPATGIVEIRARKSFDFEQDAAFYNIDIQLGEQTFKVLVRLYDVQNGTAAEPLTISSFDELSSFFKGQFVSDHIGFDLINLPVTTEQNLAKLNIRLDRDIDASLTREAGKHWPGYHFQGRLNGDNHVIAGLKMANGANFVSQPNRFETMSLINVGLTNVEANNYIISGQSGNNVTEGVFVEGVMTLSDYPLQRVNTAPFHLPGKIRRVYSNMYFDVGPARAGKFTKLGAFMSPPSSPADLHSGYSNGRIVTDPSSPMFGEFSGCMNGNNARAEGPKQFISAVQFDISNPAATREDGSYLNIGGFGSSKGPIPDFMDGSDFTWRFIKDRNNSSIVRSVGNGERDGNNDGIADDGAEGPIWESAGMLEANAKRSDNYTGAWLNGDFDLTNGHVPVLKNMPYPRIHGASWMSAPDPGVAYQHYMYDYYLQDPRNR